MAVLFGRASGQHNELLHADGLVHIGPGKAVVAVFTLGFAHGTRSSKIKNHWLENNFKIREEELKKIIINSKN